jgi:hypothetical protein
MHKEKLKGNECGWETKYYVRCGAELLDFVRRLTFQRVQRFEDWM